jgi:hypothetical protein
MTDVPETPQQRREKTCVGPDGRPLTLGDLPRSHQQRWVPRQKANVVAAVRGGLMSADGACQRYRLTTEEFMSWQRAFDSGGIAGLRVTHIKRQRKSGDGSQEKNGT